MAKDQGQTPALPRGGRSVATAIEPPKKRVGVLQFFREVRAAARKISWTSRRETWITSVMVGIMGVLTATFFFGVDWFLGLGINALLKFANAE